MNERKKGKDLLSIHDRKKSYCETNKPTQRVHHKFVVFSLSCSGARRKKHQISSRSYINA